MSPVSIYFSLIPIEPGDSWIYDITIPSQIKITQSDLLVFIICWSLTHVFTVNYEQNIEN